MIVRYLVVYLIYVNVPRIAPQEECDERLGDSCYRVRTGISTWDEAASVCRASGAHLVTVTSAEEGRVLAELVEERTFGGIWLGLREKFVPWRWINDETIFEQGCYSSSPGDISDSSIELSENGFSTCQEICRNENYKYGALKGGNRCLCGSVFQSFTVSDSCNIPCSGTYPQNQRPTCGGVDNLAIFAVDGGYSDWLPGQPNNHGGYQACGYLEIIEEEDSPAVIGWSDVICRSPLGVLCELSLDICDTDPDSLASDPDNLLSRGNDTCFLLSRTRRQSFFLVREICRGLGGDLPIFETPEESDYVIQLVRDNLAEIEVDGYWLGLTRSTWNWVTGEEMFYTNWKRESPGSPSGESEECVSMRNSVWEDHLCNEAVFNVICEFDASIIDVQETSTSDPDDVVTEVEAQVNMTTAAPYTLDDVDYALIAGLSVGLLCIIVIVVPVTCTVYRKQNKKFREKKQEAQREKYFFGLESPEETKKTKESPTEFKNEETFDRKETDSLDDNYIIQSEETLVVATLDELSNYDSGVSLPQASSSNLYIGPMFTEVEVVGEKPDLLSDLD